MEIILNLTDREVTLLRNSTSNLGTTEKDCISLQLKIANAILDAFNVELNDIGIPILPAQILHGKQ